MRYRCPICKDVYTAEMYNNHKCKWRITQTEINNMCSKNFDAVKYLRKIGFKPYVGKDWKKREDNKIPASATS